MDEQVTPIRPGSEQAKEVEQVKKIKSECEPGPIDFNTKEGQAKFLAFKKRNL